MAEPAARNSSTEISLSPLFWTRRASLTVRILVVNIVALALLAGSLFYLDSYRKQLLDERSKLARSEAQIMAEALYSVSRERRDSLILQLGKEQRLRIRFYDRKGKLVGDSFELARKAGEEPAFTMIDPASEPWYQELARTLDRGMDALLGAPPLPSYYEPAETDARAWPELLGARATGLTQVVQRYAPDRTPVITAAAPVGQRGALLLTTRNAVDITERVRGARQTLAIIIGVTLLISIQLSLFLARTIVQPLRMLVRAAVRVRLGRDREVEVPRLPERRDEIGMLARAISDMTAALRQRMDSVESFAADAAHEIKNPLASLRSALESLGQVEDPALRRQLAGIAVHDLQRIDRLVTEIADASRIDAELSRATFEPVNIALLVANLVGAREERQENEGRTIRLLQSGWESPIAMGVPVRLERVIENLIDNAVSFSPPAGTITVEIASDENWVRAVVCDQGPGIPEAERENIFARFHSVRPEAESFGNHSGLGLAIARTIAEAHEGTLRAEDRPDGLPGACLVLELPRAEVP